MSGTIDSRTRRDIEEAERLRAALERIADNKRAYGWVLAQIARAALVGDKGDGNG
jgi:hypothetical protein